MAEAYGMKVFLELVVKNVKDIEKKIQDKLGTVKTKLEGAPGGRVEKTEGGIISSLKDALKKADKAVEAAETPEDLKSAFKQQKEAQDSLADAIKKGKEGVGDKTEGLLAGILKKLGPLAVLLTLKPVTDLLQILTGFVIIGLFKLFELFKWLGGLQIMTYTFIGGKLKDLAVFLWDKIIWLGGIIRTWFDKTILWIKSLPGKIWDKIKDIALKIIELRDKIVERFIAIKDKIIELRDKIVAKIIELRDKIVDKIVELKDKFVDKIVEIKEKILELKDKFVDKIIEIKDKIIEMKDKFVDKIVELRNKVVEWFTSLVDKIKSLPRLIGEKIVEFVDKIVDKVKSFWPFGGGEDVDDALVTKRGKVVKFHPDDNIFATRGDLPEGGGSITNNFYGVTPQEMMDFIRQQLGRDGLGSSRF